MPELPPGAERCYAPEIAFEADGTLHYLFIGLRGRANSPMGVFLTTSDDHGDTFSAPRRILGRDSFAVRMAIDPTVGDHGRMHVVWLAAGQPPALGGFQAVANPIVAMHSDDGGRTFSEPMQLSDAARTRVVAPALALGADQRVYVAYYDLGDDAVDYQGLEGPTWETTWSVVAATSSDGGESFAAGVVVDDAVVPPERVMLVFTMPPPALAADAGGHVYAAFADATSGDWDVWLRASPDGGRTWQHRRRLNDDPVGNGRHQYLPRLSVATSGHLDAAFYDRRHDVENVRNDVYYTSSSDGGASVSANVRVTTQGFRSDIGPTYPIPSAAGLVDFGSRLGLVSHGERAVVAWTDTRNSLPGEQQDIFATEVGSPGSPGADVPLTRAGGGSRWFLRVGLAGAAVVAAAVVVVVLLRRRPATAGGDGREEPARHDSEPERPSDGAIADGRAGTGDDP